MTCKLCQLPLPPNYISPRRCAFDESGNWTSENWMCGTACALRDRCLWSLREDSSAGSIGVVLIPEWGGGCETPDEFPRGYVVLNWYKERGATWSAMIVGDDVDPKPLTLAGAELVLEALGRLDARSARKRGTA